MGEHLEGRGIQPYAGQRGAVCGLVEGHACTIPLHTPRAQDLCTTVHGGYWCRSEAVFGVSSGNLGARAPTRKLEDCCAVRPLRGGPRGEKPGGSTRHTPVVRVVSRVRFPFHPHVR